MVKIAANPEMLYLRFLLYCAICERSAEMKAFEI